MPISIQDYLLDQESVDWPTVLAGWSWSLPPEFRLLMANRFCDLFLVPPDGTVHLLDVGAGSLTKVAESRDDFSNKFDEGETANNWLMIPLVDRLVAAGMELKPGECYGFKMPPVFGGKYSVENCAVLPIADLLGAYGSIHEQLRDVPDGAQVTLRVVDRSGAR
jgi:hypothetical protein